MLLEFVPEGAELSGLIGRQQAEDAGGGHGFARMLVGHVFRVVGEGVASVDLHEVVDQHHLQDVQDVERLVVGVLGEHDDHQREVPGMLGAVLGAAALGQDGLPEDLFQLVDLGDEGDLAAETFGGGEVGGVGRHETHE